MVRMSAEERRAAVIAAAVEEFARTGYRGTSTEVIARRVGVSQPYLFRLFPNKQAIFLAAVESCLEKMRGVMVRAGEGVEGVEAVEAMGAAYQTLIAEDPAVLDIQLQLFAAAAAARVSGDEEFAAAVRRKWLEVWDAMHLALGADIEETTTFMAYGMLVNVLRAMGFPPDHRVWDGIYEKARPVGDVG
ncbi:TetR/AcrR family transcriptional regulator [Streptomyces sp. NA04227]|uniref:TetR/AcrR family transcriptional regulator n=1 Tax=Streptomyces sp. NA04227 TaxID=2742136 RepID=UPI001592866D|nr:TetR/AcrR family transcriptional regulator [Streptomyces sp. NA04227]QKW08568.1 TetR/AcrR family transcriptional regulator [Streptomyces sp. NA04227]